MKKILDSCQLLWQKKQKEKPGVQAVGAELEMRWQLRPAATNRVLLRHQIEPSVSAELFTTYYGGVSSLSV